MDHEPSSKTWKIGCLSAAAVIIAAIIGLGAPFAERIADVYFPLPTTTINAPAPTQVIIVTVPPQPTQPFTLSPTLAPTFLPPTSNYAEKLCPYRITQSEVNALSNGTSDVQTVQSYIDRFDAGRPNDGGAFVIGTRIPPGVVVATNFDEVNPNKWLEYPVTALIHSGSWGLFQTLGEYIAPNAGACRVIVP